MHSKSTAKLSPRCLRLLALAALVEPAELVQIAYAVKNDPQLHAVRVARGWRKLTEAELRRLARQILGHTQ